MPLERIILIPYGGENHIIHNCEKSDAKAVKQAIRELARLEGKNHIKVDLKDVLIKLK
jgi:hypothetical protein